MNSTGNFLSIEFNRTCAYTQLSYSHYQLKPLKRDVYYCTTKCVRKKYVALPLTSWDYLFYLPSSPFRFSFFFLLLPSALNSFDQMQWSSIENVHLIWLISPIFAFIPIFDPMYQPRYIFVHRTRHIHGLHSYALVQDQCNSFITITIIIVHFSSLSFYCTLAIHMLYLFLLLFSTPTLISPSLSLSPCLDRNQNAIGTIKHRNIKSLCSFIAACQAQMPNDYRISMHIAYSYRAVCM